MADRSIKVTLQANVQDFMANMKSAGKATDQLATSLGGAEKVASTTLGRMAQSARQQGESWQRSGALIQRAGAAMTGGLVLAGKAAMDWESAWTGVTKTVDGTPEQMSAIESSLRSLARELPASHDGIAAVAEAAGQLGIQAGNVVTFTKTMLDLGEATNMTADEAATQLARFANIMGTSQSKFSNIGSAVVELGNNFASTESEIVHMGMRLAGAGRQAGLTEGEVLGLSTALSSVGIEAEAGGTAMSRVLIEMRKAVDTTSPKLDAFAKAAGMSAEEFATAFRDDAGGAVTAFIEGLGAMDKAGQSVQPVLEELGLTDVRVGNALRTAAAASELFAGALTMGNSAFEENKALAEEAEKRYATVTSRAKIAWNSIKDAAISAGMEMLPLVADLADKIAALAGWFADLPSPVQKAMLSFTAFVGIGGLLVGTFMRLFPAMLETVDHLRALGAISPGAAEAVGRVLGKMWGGIKTVGLFAAKMGLALAAVGAIAGGVKAAVRAMQGFEDVSKGPKAMEAALREASRSGEFYNEVLGDMVTRGGALKDRFGDLTTTLESLANSGLADRVFSNFLWTGWDITADGFGAMRQEVEQLDGALSSMAQMSLPDAQRAFQSMASEIDLSRVSQQEVLDLMPNFRDELKLIASEAGLTADAANLWKLATGEVVPVIDEATGEVTLLSAEQAKLRDQTSSASDAIAEQNDQLEQNIARLRDAFDIVVSVNEAERAWIEQLEATSEAIKRNGATLDRNTEAGRENERAIEALAGQFFTTAEAMAKAGESAEDINARLSTQREKFIEQAQAVTGSREAAEALADQYELFPNEVVTEIKANAESARQELDAIVADIETSGGEVDIDGTTFSGEMKLDELLKHIGTSREEVGIGGDDTEGVVTVNDYLKWVKGQRPKIPVNSETTAARENAAKLMRWIGQGVTLPVRASGIDGIRGAIRSLSSSIAVNVQMRASMMADGGPVLAFANGGAPSFRGLVHGPGGPRDDKVPAMLSSGEFVVREAAVRHYGLDTLMLLNAKRLAGGGPARAYVAPQQQLSLPRFERQTATQIIQKQTVHQHIQTAFVQPDSEFISNQAAEAREFMRAGV